MLVKILLFGVMGALESSYLSKVQ